MLGLHTQEFPDTCLKPPRPWAESQHTPSPAPLGSPVSCMGYLSPSCPQQQAGPSSGSTSPSTPQIWGGAVGAGVLPQEEAPVPPDTLAVKGEAPAGRLLLLCPRCSSLLPASQEGPSWLLPGPHPHTPASYDMAQLPSTSHLCQVLVPDLGTTVPGRSSATCLLGSLEDWP